MLFEAHFETAAMFKRIIEALRDVVTHVTFDCDDDGMHLQSMDGMHVALACLHLKTAAFQTYRCARSISMSMPLDNLRKILKCAADKNGLSIKAQNGGDVATFVIIGTHNTTISTYTLKLMTIDVEHLGVPDCEYACTVSMSSVRFAQICRDLLHFDESVIIRCGKKGIQFRVNGDIGSADVQVNASETANDDDNFVVIRATESITHTFAGKYLHNFAKAAALSANVIISLSNDLPLKVEYCIGDAGALQYFLAPKVVNDDDDNTTNNIDY
ncbi:pcna [Cyclophragma undans nucleopolyhedrovirus]|uniref:Pcna n=1 Tax=Cyclophragma undans nucleopolyhedrovirus TaxID=1906244 RepID=A0A288QB53_9ABAC|nr:pcna [Cyclophragma undans nucleopolyhedrovirus]AOT85561.1 pcna [Cyclophragma undans nucleopolyhedrovirus]